MIKLPCVQTARVFVCVSLMMLFMMGVIHTQEKAQNDIPSDQIQEVLWSPTGDRIALSHENGQIQIVESGDFTKTTVLRGHTDGFTPIVWSPDGRQLASGGSNPDNSLRIWDTTNGKEMFKFAPVGNDVLTVEWKPDGSQVMAFAAESLSGYDAIAFNPITQEVKTESMPTIVDIAWSPDLEQIGMLTMGSVDILDAFTLKKLVSYPIDQKSFREGLQKFPTVITWSPDGREVAWGMGDGRIFIWNPSHTEPRLMLVGHDFQGEDWFLGWIYALRYDDTGKMLTSVAGDGTIRTWDTSNGDLISEQTTTQNWTADFSPTGARVVLGLAPEAVSTRTSDGLPIEIVVLDPTLEGLQKLANQCGLSKTLTTADLSDFVKQVKTTSIDAIPSACAADLIAVAEAIVTQP